MESQSQQVGGNISLTELGDYDKGQAEQIETSARNNNQYTADEQEFLDNFTDERKAKLYRKIDWRLVPMLALLYLFSCM